MNRKVDILVLKSNKKKKKHIAINRPFTDEEIPNLMAILDSFDDVEESFTIQKTQKELSNLYRDENRVIRQIAFQNYIVKVYVKHISIDIVFMEQNTFKYVVRKFFK